MKKWGNRERKEGARLEGNGGKEERKSCCLQFHLKTVS